MTEAELQFESFVARFLPDIAEAGRAGVAKLRALLPECDVLVYDNYNALVAGFSPDGRTSSALLSLTLYPRWVSLFVSAELDDPHGLLEGGGGTVRHVKMKGGASDLGRPEVAALITQSRERAGAMIVEGRSGELIVRSVSAKQRPRRP
ncbi:MAG: hypothetical protein KGL44_12565 [Sphingomonadales bacterium]|nr:hypothetical protein [Sphingomonadales bacterium]